jgi:Arc/MetJ-type ribon-helix-helix transcriptional regulator
LKANWNISSSYGLARWSFIVEQARRATPDLCIVSLTDVCQFKRMEVTVTKPIEEFIEQQLAKGYANAGEVARQALLRWMEEEEFEPDPPRLREKLEAARQGKFRPYDPKAYDALLNSPDVLAR